MDLKDMPVDEAEKYFWRKYMESNRDPDKLDKVYIELMEYPRESEMQKHITARIKLGCNICYKDLKTSMI